METRFCTEIPRLPSSRLCMDEDATTNQTKWCLVEAKGPLVKFSHFNPWIEHGLTEKIEGEFSLWQKRVPKVWGKCGVIAGQYCQEVVLDMQIAHSAWFWQCISGGTSWNLAFHLKVMASLHAALALLTRIWRSTKRPLAARHVIMTL